VSEIWVEGIWLRYKTRRPLRTLRKIAERGYAAFLRYNYGWIRLTPEDVEKLVRGETVSVPYFLEHPRFGGVRAHTVVMLSPESFS
jgi:hypothetical protein